jgi:hypothetical protein
MAKRLLSTVSLPSLNTAPTGANVGELYYNTLDKTVHSYTGTEWRPLSVDYMKEMFLGGAHEGININYDSVANTLNLDLDLTKYSLEPGGFENRADAALIWDGPAKSVRLEITGNSSLYSPYGASPYTFKGAYDNGADYNVDDVVTYNGQYYVRILPVNPGYPPGTAYWGTAHGQQWAEYFLNQYIYYVQGKKFTRFLPDAMNIPDDINGLIPGIYYIYYGADGELARKTTPFNFKEDCPVAVVVIGEDRSVLHVGEERHGIAMDWATQYYLHRTFGTQSTGGFNVGNYNIGADGTSNSDYQFSLTGGTIYDEDSDFEIIHSASPDSEGEQILEPIANLPVIYRAGATGWSKKATSPIPINVDVAGVPQINVYSGSSWISQPVGNNKYYAIWVVATNNIIHPIISIMGQREDNSITAAKANNTYNSLELLGIPGSEFYPLYRVILEHKGSYTNAAQSVIQDILDIRSSSGTTSGGGSTAVPEHGELVGLLDDDHTQYIHISNPRTIVAAHTFNPSSVGPAFVLGPNAQDYLIEGLNAEMVGGNTLTQINSTAFNYSSSAKDDAIAASNGYTDGKFTNIDTYVAPLLNHSSHDGVQVTWNDSENKITLNVEEPVRVSNTPPSNVAEGDQWYDNQSGVMYVYDGSYWVEVSGGLGADAAELPSTVQYLNGVTSNIQSQINSKAPIASPTFTGTVNLPATTLYNGTNLSIISNIPNTAPKDSPTFTGTVSLPSTTSIGNVSSTEISQLDGVTSNIQNQINAKISANNPTLTGIVNLPSTTYIGEITPIELGHLDGVTGSVQTQLDDKVSYGNFNTANIAVQTYATLASLPVASANTGRVVYVSGEGYTYYSHNNAWIKVAKFSDIATGGAAFPINELSDVDTATTSPSAGQVLSWDGGSWVPATIAGGTGSAPLESPSFTGNVFLPSTTTIGDISSTELSYLNGVSSAIQDQIDEKSPINDPVFTGVVVLPQTTNIGNVSEEEIAHLNGVTSSIQTQINSKLNTTDFKYTNISLDLYATVLALPSAASNTGRIAFVSADQSIYVSTGTVWVRLAKASEISGTTVSTINDLNDVDTETMSPTSGQVLYWNGIAWVPQTLSIPTIVPTYPAITQLEVTNNGAMAYNFLNQYTGDNPALYAISATTIAFKLNVPGHPFLIQDSVGANYNNGLVHVATDGTVTTGSNAQGKTSGTLYWQIPATLSGTYKYQCQLHSMMNGQINIKDITLI